MLLATDLAVLDHADGTVLLIANAVNYDDTDERVDEAYADAVARLDAMTADLAAARRRARPSTFDADAEPRTTSNARRAPTTWPPSSAPRRRSGPARPSRSSSRQRFEMPTDGRPRSTSTGCCGVTNPSPYMYLLRFDGFDVVGSSPEALVKVDRRPRAAAPDRRHPLARRDARGGRAPRRPSCSPTRRSAPST